jgi:arginine decarboxylase
MVLVPRMAYLTRGTGVHREPLIAFELALRDAGIAAQNLVAVSSILPPGCPVISRQEGERHLRPGQVLFVVMSRNDTTRHIGHLGASVGLATPADRTQHGFVSEYHSEGLSEAAMARHAEDLAATMLGTLQGVDLDPSLGWEERTRVLSAAGTILDRSSVSMVTDAADGVATCVLAACVFVMEWMLNSK